MTAELGRHRGMPETLRALLAYLPVLLVTAWPLVLRLATHVQEGGDAGSYVWGFWWVGHALAGLDNPFGSDAIFAPTGTPLAFHTMMSTLALASLPLQPILGVATTYNLVLLAAPLCAALAMFRLGRDLDQPPVGAWVAGLVFGFAPVLLDRLDIEHLNLAFTAWLPLSVLGLRRALAGRSALLLGLVTAGAVATDLTTTVLAGFACLAYLAGWLWLHRREAPLLVRAAGRLAMAMAVAIAAASPLLVAMAQTAAAGEYAPVPGLGGAERYAADLVSFVAPTPRHRFLGGLGHDVQAAVAGRPADGAATLGLTGLALAGWGAVVWRRRRVARWALGLVVLGVLLALGPQLYVAGTRVTPTALSTADGESWLLPATWVRGIPGLDGLRAPVRFLPLATLGLAVLAGAGAATVAARRSRVLVLVLIASAIAFEGATTFRSLAPARAPSVYAQLPQDAGIVVDVPVGFRSGFTTIGVQQGRPMVWATVHGRSIAIGFGARTTDQRLTRQAEIPLYRDLLALQDPGVPDDGVSHRQGARSARGLGISAVVVHGDYPEVAAYLERAGFEPAARDGDVSLWVLP